MPLFSSFTWFSNSKAHMKHLGHLKKQQEKPCAWVLTQNKEIRISGHGAQAAIFLDISLSWFKCSIMNENHCCRSTVVCGSHVCLRDQQHKDHLRSWDMKTLTPLQAHRIRICTLVRVPEGLHTQLVFEKYWNNQWLSTLTACRSQSRSF